MVACKEEKTLVNSVIYIKRHLPSSSFSESQHHRRSRLSVRERTQLSIPTAKAVTKVTDLNIRIMMKMESGNHGIPFKFYDLK